MSEFLEKLERYGADVPGTMARFLGDEALYAECTRIFLEDQNFTKLGAALESADYDAAFQCAHTLQGVVGNLGLTPLYNAANALTEALQAEKREQIAVLYACLAAEMERFKAQI